MTQSSSTASTDATRGILWILFGMVLFTNVNAITKTLTETYPLVEVVWSRFLFHSLFVVLVFRGRIPSLLACNAPRLQIGRSAIMMVTTTLIFLSLHLNPMVETSAILATAPIILTALSGPVLGEPVGLRRWVAVLIAFTGAVIIIRPGSAMMQTVIFAPVVAAFSLAIYQTATRLVSRRDLVMTTVVYTPIVGLVVSSMVVPFVWVMPTPADWLLMAAFGAFGLGRPLHADQGFRRGAGGDGGALQLFGHLMGGAVWLFHIRRHPRWLDDRRRRGHLRRRFVHLSRGAFAEGRKDGGMSEKPAGGASDIRRGILWMVLTMFIFASINAVAKTLAETYPVAQVVWARYAFHVVLLVLLLRGRLFRIIISRALGLQLTRSVLMVSTTGLYFAALHLLPLADVGAIMYVAPLVVTLLSVPLLGEAVGPRRWAGVCVGFIGALVVIRPGAGVMQVAAFLPLAAAVLHALYQITTRKVSAVDSPMTSLVYTALVGSIVTTVGVPLVWVEPDIRGWALMMLIGLLGGSGHFALIKAFQAAPAASVTPFGYTTLIWLTAYGYVLFGDLPDRMTVAGALIIVLSGLYVFRREQVHKTTPGASPDTL